MKPSGSLLPKGIEILTDIPAGERDDQGEFPTDSVNGKVEKQLLQFAEQARFFQSGTQEPNRRTASTPREDSSQKRKGKSTF